MTSANRRKAFPLTTDIQLQNRYSDLGTGEEEQDLTEDTSKPGESESSVHITNKKQQLRAI